MPQVGSHVVSFIRERIIRVEHLEGGSIATDEFAKIVARALREGGMLASADRVVTAARSALKK